MFVCSLIRYCRPSTSSTAWSEGDRRADLSVGLLVWVVIVTATAMAKAVADCRWWWW